MNRLKPLLDIPEHHEALLIDAARDGHPVSGLTHNYYRYPARFSPTFARAAIETFTQPGDVILDPHVGGGTTLVEALATGRNAIGVDISALAEFVTGVKTTVLSDAELKRLGAWTKRLSRKIDVRKRSIHLTEYAEGGYYKHLDHPTRWRLRKAIEQGLHAAVELGSPRLESFGRCVILRTAQWALDGRAILPSLPEFRDMLTTTAAEMLEGARAAGCGFDATTDRQSHQTISRRSRNRWALSEIRGAEASSDIPPYPGVHVLYHRWQVDGRKEAPLPFMIANKLDGAGSSYYTMGDRKYPELATYFESIKATMSSVAALADERTVIVQMVAFSDPSWQLKRYLLTMEEAGLSEVFLATLRGERDGRLWRCVPNRRWYSDQRGQTPGSQEVVLIHRKADNVQTQPAVRQPSATSWARSGTKAR